MISWRILIRRIEADGERDGRLEEKVVHVKQSVRVADL